MKMLSCCDEKLTKTTAAKLATSNDEYETGFVCDYCNKSYGVRNTLYHCYICKDDECVKCYQEREIDEANYMDEDEDEKSADDGSNNEEDEEEDLTSDREDDDNIHIGEYALEHFNRKFMPGELAKIGNIAKIMFYYKYGVVPVFEENIRGRFKVNYYDAKDVDVVERAIKFYIYK